ncbi:MAG: M15 family metallopeptidase [Acidimicrobiales bacterium]
MPVRWSPLAGAVALAALAAACGSSPKALVATSPPAPTAVANADDGAAPPTEPATVAPTTASPAPAPSPPAPAASAWVLGARPLPLGSDGTPLVLPTPTALRDRRLGTVDRLPPPPADAPYRSTAGPIDAGLATRIGTTWQPGCPVPLSGLSHLTLSFWGFDGRPHTGELVVNASVAGAVQRIFGRLYAGRFPIEDMRIVEPADLTEVATGDGNTTAAFVCRPIRGSTTTTSAHSSGLAIDVNPFQNPYKKGSSVLPELAGAYLERTWSRPGMITRGDVVTRAFAAEGWSWGGTWTSSTDLMHFSANGR